MCAAPLLWWEEAGTRAKLERHKREDGVEPGMTRFMKLWILTAALVASSMAFAQDGGLPNVMTANQQIMVLANQARAEVGVGRLEWDPALAAAALYHCRRMAAEGPIAHQYRGEADLAGRAGQAGGHFNFIEENVAVGPTAAVIHEEWMHSPGHRTNLLSPDVNRIGVAVVQSRGVLYAVADYSRGVQSLTATEVEARVAGLIKQSGVSVVADPPLARRTCGADSGVPQGAGFVMRWQGTDLTQLPKALTDRLASGGYQKAAVGSCPARGADGAFTAYRLAVVLY